MTKSTLTTTLLVSVLAILMVWSMVAYVRGEAQSARSAQALCEIHEISKLINEDFSRSRYYPTPNALLDLIALKYLAFGCGGQSKLGGHLSLDPWGDKYCYQVGQLNGKSYAHFYSRNGVIRDVRDDIVGVNAVEVQGGIQRFLAIQRSSSSDKSSCNQVETKAEVNK